MDVSLSFFKKPHKIKKESSHRFNRWSRKYDRSILQFLMFSRSHDLFIENILRERGISRVLDIGCGTGEFAIKLKKYKSSAEIFGIDISEDMINTAKSKPAAEGIDFRTGDSENIPHDDDYFDCITCAHSFHHYPHKKKAVREMFRVLRNNGTLMIIDGCKDGLLGKVIFDFFVKAHEVNVHHLHSSQFRRIMANAGFENIVQARFNLFIPLLFTKGVAGKEGKC